MDRAEAANTFTVLPGSTAALVWPLVAAMARNPRRWLLASRTAARHSPPGPLRWLRALAYLAEGMRLAAEMERRGVTHVHSHFANAAAVAGLAASRYLGIGWSVTLHGMSDFAGPLTPLLAERVTDASFVATVTEWGRERLLETIGPRDAGKIHLVRCGVEVERLPPPRRTAPGPGDTLEVRIGWTPVSGEGSRWPASRRSPNSSAAARIAA